MNRIFLLALLVLCSCNVSRLKVKEGPPLQSLGIFYEAHPDVPLVISDGLSKRIDEFIIRHNSEGKGLRLHRVISPTESSLTIKLLGSQLVTSSQQTAGVVVSTLGLSLPFIMAASESEFIIFFYYFPKAQSYFELTLSPEINSAPGGSINRIYQSPGFLRSPERQVKRHLLNFNRFLKGLVFEIEQ